MALPPSRSRLAYKWILIGGVVGGGLRWAGAPLWVAIAAGLVVGFLTAIFLENRRIHQAGPHGPGPPA